MDIIRLFAAVRKAIDVGLLPEPASPEGCIAGVEAIRAILLAADAVGPGPPPGLPAPYIYECAGCGWTGAAAEVASDPWGRAYCPQCLLVGVLGNLVVRKPLSEVPPR